ncbi:hypothetical protein [Streptococcus pyogenes]|uniref:hypothetical protein n=1 Tax=Streptococcus pyogenes TaxID=1314 RepID=UPI0004D0C2A8|nr:hypothetical protein [Streptococcus pyogenes]AIG50401.1 multidrug transporter [Streptococcus pyogenes STAB901]AIW11824.1 multidrug transporter [Streptococcus pyogenes]OAC82014.1 multidrug transporter [Streptococcus pyogenes]OAC83570.1 multidrug transporter [Streptococcus pyogenes]OAC84376.1 multidrug transporter [Streptococcus pyogenes]
MKNAISILALLTPENQLEETFIRELSHHFSHLFEVTILTSKANIESNQLSTFQGIFSFHEHDIDLPTLYFKTSQHGQGFLVTESVFDQATAVLSLSQYLTGFYQKFDGHFLQYLPLQARLSDANGNIIVDNHAFNGSFLPTTDKEIEDWILAELRLSDNPCKTFLLPSGSLDHIYMQHYQALKNLQGQLVGVLDTVQDIKPLLNQYLEETGQAIVGWSDVTSGPSILDH